MVWAIVAALVVVVFAPLALALVRRPAGAADPVAHDLSVYRDQLREVERDLARGVIAAEDGARVRAEVGRRVLEADRIARTGADIPVSAPRQASIVGLALAALMLFGAVWLYAHIGAPGFPDLPIADRIEAAETRRTERPAQATAETEAQADISASMPEPAADYVKIVEQLRTAVAGRPGDRRGLELLATHEAGIGNFGAAHKAQADLIALKGDAATPADYAALADLMILAAGGYVSPEAEAALTETLRRDPANGTARYYSGLMMAQTGRPDLAFRLWRPLLEEGPADAPWIAPIRAEIGLLAEMAGVTYTLPEAPGGAAPGPTAGDVAAAADMTGTERAEMIRGMVAQLSDRLASEGGTPEEWARLIGSLGVLGDTDQARAIWTEAQTRFAGREAELATIRAAAEQAGVTE